MISRSRSGQISLARDLRRIDAEKKKEKAEKVRRSNRLRSRVRLRKNDFERGVYGPRTDKALEVLLSSKPRKSVVIFSARARARALTHSTQRRLGLIAGGALFPRPMPWSLLELPRVLGEARSPSLFLHEGELCSSPFLLDGLPEFPSLSFSLFCLLSLLPSTTIMCIT